MATALGIHVQTRARFRDSSGRFLAEADAACVASAEQLAEMVANLANASAWRTSGPVTAASHGFSAVATAFGFTAGIQEFGAAPHRIEPGLSHGYLANEGAGFGPVRGGVNHPGVKARHFMSRASAVASTMGPALVARNLPL